MPEKKQFRAIKGTRDILPPDSTLWNWFEQTARHTFESYNFREIRLPIFEERSLFARSVGGETDIVAKEMFDLDDPVGSQIATLVDALNRYPAWAKGGVSIGEFFNLAVFLKDLLEMALDKGEIPKTRNRALHSRLETELDLFKRSFGSSETLDSDMNSGEPAQLQQAIDSIKRLTHEIEYPEKESLRPEATASTMRAYIEHGMHTLPGNVKLYYMGPMFRRERPQKGRYRQFYQIGAEVLGQSDAPAIDAEVIEMLMTFFQRVGLTRTTLYINSIGDKNCRPQYIELLREELRKVKDQLGPDSQRRIETNALRVLDSKSPAEQPIIEKLPRIADHLCDACRENYAKLKEELNLRGIAFQENWRLVRGLDYYTRTTFEVIAEGLGSQNAVCGGGRYDGLVEMLGGPPTKGIGFAIGSDRAILSIQESGNLPKLPTLDVFIAWMGRETYPAAVAISRKLRDAGISVELPGEEFKFKKSLSLADKLGARYALIIGSDEVASHAYALKRLADGAQHTLSEAQLIETLEREKVASD